LACIFGPVFAHAGALILMAGTPSAQLKGTTTGLFAQWYHMKTHQLPNNALFESARPVRLTTVSNLNFKSTDEPFANSGLKSDYAARFEGY
jgi:hypothetical protein